MFLTKSLNKSFEFVKVDDLNKWRNYGEAIQGKFDLNKVSDSEWNFIVGKGAKLFERLDSMSIKLGNLAHLFVGLQTNADDIFILEEITKKDNRVLCKSKLNNKEYWFEDSHVKHFLKGSVNIRRYYLDNVNKRLIFPYEMQGDKSVLISQEDYKKKCPLTWNYLNENKKILSSRNIGEMGKEWYGYVYKKNHTRLSLPKLVVPSLANQSSFAPDLKGEYYFAGSGGGGGGGYGIILNKDESISYYYLLGVLNSKIATFFLKNISTTFRGGYMALNRQYIEKIPIRTINFDNIEDIVMHDKVA